MTNKLTLVQKILLKYFRQDIRVLIKEDEYDSMLNQVVEFILDREMIGLRDLELQFKISYTRAERILKQLSGLNIIPYISIPDRPIDKKKARDFLENQKQ